MWLWLVVAILTEVAATLCLRMSDGFSRLIPSAVVIVGYAIAFYALSRALVLGMEVSTAYAVWSGVGISLIAVLGTLLFDERPTAVQILGLGLVVAGVAALQLGATTV